MSPALRRQNQNAAPTRPPRAGRAGFTLVEMLVSVTLVLLMMLMFAEIYGLAQNTISTQRGIAENDQKARILAEVLRRDLQTRTFRDVYPFRFEFVNDFPSSDDDRSLLERRRGYFSYSENDPDLDTDDAVQFTVAADQQKWGRPGDRLYGAALSPDDTGAPAVYVGSLVNGAIDSPEFDDGFLGNRSGASGAAEVSYFLRNGNLYRASLLVRQPYLKNDPNLSTAGRPTPDGFPAAYPQFWKDFDYSAYRFPTSGIGTPYIVQFHSNPESLENDASKNLPADYLGTAAQKLVVPKALSVPHLRFGHYSGRDDGSIIRVAPPFEFTDGTGDFQSVVSKSTIGFFGRFLNNERSSVAFAYPGEGFSPFDGMTTVTDSDANNHFDNYADGGRRGVDLMLSNVHAFDVQVWDDIVGDFVDLGHELSGNNPYKAPGSPAEVGFYHRERMREDPANPGNNFYGNRYDTWNPRMYIDSGSGGIPPAAGRTPYRPQQLNQDPNIASFSPLEVEFGDNYNGTELDGSDHPAGEVPLRAIRIRVRYLDPASGQTRQATIEQSLID